MAGFEAGTEYKTADGKRIGKNPDDGFGRGSFWTLGIPYKTLAGIGSIPACFITMQKVKNPDF